MHWSKRAAIAITGTMLVISIPYLLLDAVIIMPGGIAHRVRTDLIPAFFGACLAVLYYGLLTRKYPPRPLDGECHCRNCDHILRGITEPRCPECGEKI